LRRIQGQAESITDMKQIKLTYHIDFDKLIQRPVEEWVDSYRQTKRCLPSVEVGKTVAYYSVKSIDPYNGWDNSQDMFDSLEEGTIEVLSRRNKRKEKIKQVIQDLQEELIKLENLGDAVKVKLYEEIIKETTEKEKDRLLSQLK